MLNDTLANTLSNILSATNSGKTQCSVAPASKLISSVLDIMQKQSYIGSYQIQQTLRGGRILITLIGAVNKCGAIKPRFSVTKDGYEKFEKRYLPAKDFGALIVSTPKGIMTHIETRPKKLGESLLAYVY